MTNVADLVKSESKKLSDIVTGRVDNYVRNYRNYQDDIHTIEKIVHPAWKPQGSSIKKPFFDKELKECEIEFKNKIKKRRYTTTDSYWDKVRDKQANSTLVYPKYKYTDQPIFTLS